MSFFWWVPWYFLAAMTLTMACSNGHLLSFHLPPFEKTDSSSLWSFLTNLGSFFFLPFYASSLKKLARRGFSKQVKEEGELQTQTRVPEQTIFSHFCQIWSSSSRVHWFEVRYKSISFWGIGRGKHGEIKMKVGWNDSTTTPGDAHTMQCSLCGNRGVQLQGRFVCKSVWYCDQTCQKLHHCQHKDLFRKRALELLME